MRFGQHRLVVRVVGGVAAYLRQLTGSNRDDRRDVIVTVSHNAAMESFFS